MSHFRFAALASVVLFPCFSAYSQPISVGVVGGGALTSGFEMSTIPASASGFSPSYSFYSTSKGYVVGASIEVRLPFRLSIEADALSHPLSYASAATYPVGAGSYTNPSATVLTWEVPLLVKYRFSNKRINPFVEAGPSFRASGNPNGTAPSNYGISIGGGVELRALLLRFAPEIRYTRWAVDQPVPPWAKTNPNQAELLVGFSFP